MEELVFFDPDAFKGREQEPTTEAYALTQDKLLEYGKMATEIRAAFDVKAQAMQDVSSRRQPLRQVPPSPAPSS